MEEVCSNDLDSVSGQIAVHYEQAGQAEQAINYYRRAANVAQRTFSNAEARSQLIQALTLLQVLPDTVERSRTELSLLIGLGTALMAIKGYGHPEVEQTLLHAWNLCQKLGNHEQSIPVLTDLWLCYNQKGDLAQQAIWSARLEREVRNSSMKAFQTIAHLTLAGTALFSGDFLAAKQYAEGGLATFDPEQPNSPNSSIEVDPGIMLLPGLALSLWVLGYPDQARQYIQLALDLAYRSSQPATIGAAMSMAAMFYQWRGDVTLTGEQAAGTIAYAREKSIPQWVAHGHILHGWSIEQLRKNGEGIQQLRQGLIDWQVMGSQLFLTYYLLLLAEICTLSNQLDQGYDALAEALAIVQAGGESWMEAELYRYQGEILLRRGADEQEVEACYQQALEIARLQQARSFELRATMSLCRLWQNQGKQVVAREVLAESYNWFSEGFKTADLHQAKALLNSL
jgi:predicted ATPase